MLKMPIFFPKTTSVPVLFSPLCLQNLSFSVISITISVLWKKGNFLLKVLPKHYVMFFHRHPTQMLPHCKKSEICPCLRWWICHIVEGVAGSHSSCEFQKRSPTSIIWKFRYANNILCMEFQCCGLLLCWDSKIKTPPPPLKVIWLGFFPLHFQTHSYICTFLFLPDASLYLPQFSSLCLVHKHRLTCTPARCQTSDSWS